MRRSAGDHLRRLQGKGWNSAASPVTARAIVTNRVADAPPGMAGKVEASCVLCTEPVLISSSTLAACGESEIPPIWCAHCALRIVRQRQRGRNE